MRHLDAKSCTREFEGSEIDLRNVPYFITFCEKMSSEDADKVKESVKDYYGKKLKTSDDLQTNACKLGDNRMSPAVKSALKLIHDEVSSK